MKIPAQILKLKTHQIKNVLIVTCRVTLQKTAEVDLSVRIAVIMATVIGNVNLITVEILLDHSTISTVIN